MRKKLVEKEIVDKMKKYIEEKNIILTKEKKEQTGVILNIDIIIKEIDKMKTQLEKVYEAFESGVYESDVFVKRKSIIEEKLNQLSIKKEELTNNNTISEEELKIKIIHLKDMLDNYYDIMNIEERNKLLKSLIVEVIYSRNPNQNDFDIEIITKI